ncbi:hypothetical protein SAMN02787099_00269 [Lysinibacillus fusiformis]|nr:hypothetical protein SAMN02787099_00269 [Lysinibacillus fusiformis]
MVSLVCCLVVFIGCFFIFCLGFRIGGEALSGYLLVFVCSVIITGLFFVVQFVLPFFSFVTFLVIGCFFCSLFFVLFALFFLVSFFVYAASGWWSLLGLGVIWLVFVLAFFALLLACFGTAVLSLGILGETVGPCVLASFVFVVVISVPPGICMVVLLLGLGFFLLVPGILVSLGLAASIVVVFFLVGKVYGRLLVACF